MRGYTRAVRERRARGAARQGPIRPYQSQQTRVQRDTDTATLTRTETGTRRAGFSRCDARHERRTDAADVKFENRSEKTEDAR